MKATGIVRRIDDLGRVVIPKEIRRTMRIREGDPLEIYTDTNGEVIFKKYSPMGELEPYTRQYAEVLGRTASLPVVICDRDRIVAVSGISKKDCLDKRISPFVEKYIENRKSFVWNKGEAPFPVADGILPNVAILSPIISSGDVLGAVIMLMNEKGSEPDSTDVKLVQVASSFLSRQMEE